MANIIETDNINYTYPGKMSTDIFMGPAVAHRSIRDSFIVMPNLKVGEVMHTLQPMGMITKADQGCGDKTTTGNINQIESPTLTVDPAEIYLEQCADELEGKIFAELLRSGFDRGDLNGTVFLLMLEQYIRNAAGRDFARLAWFGDKNISLTTTAFNVYFNFTNGAWPTLIANAGQGDYSVKRQFNYIDSLEPADCYEYFRQVYNNQPLELLSYPAEKTYKVTRNLYNGLRDYYQQKNVNQAYIDQKTGIEFLTFNNERVVAMPEWDYWIKYAGLGNNVRCLYTVRDNHVIGMDGENDANRTRFWFDPDKDLNKFSIKYRIGYKQIHPNLQSIAYGNVAE